MESLDDEETRRDELLREARRQADASYKSRLQDAQLLTQLGCYGGAQQALDYMPSSASEMSDEEQDAAGGHAEASDGASEDGADADGMDDGSGSGSGSEESAGEESADGSDDDDDEADPPFIETAKEGMASALRELFASEVERGVSADQTFDQLRALSRGAQTSSWKTRIHPVAGHTSCAHRVLVRMCRC